MSDFWTSVSIKITTSPLERYISMSLIKKDMVITWEKLFKVIFLIVWDISPFSLHKRVISYNKLLLATSPYSFLLPKRYRHIHVMLGFWVQGREE